MTDADNAAPETLAIDVGAPDTPATGVSETDAPPAATPASETPPDRLSNNPDSPHYDAALLERGIGIRFKGVERTNVDEYCVSEGWVRLTVAASNDRYGNPITIKQQGTVEPYFRS